MLETLAPPVPWEMILKEKFLYEDRCWTTCNGFCCSISSYADFDFRLIPTQGMTILFMEDEYNWLATHGRVVDPNHPDAVPNLVSIDFGGPRPMSLVQMPCRLLGKCQGVIDKPLLCKLYPMLPLLDVDGNLAEMQESSIFELTMQLQGIKTPCTVVDKRKHYLRKWQNSPESLRVLKHPYIIFYLQAAKHFGNIYCELFKANSSLRNLTGKAFWQAWEMEYLMGNLMDGDRLAEKIKQTYDVLVDLYGSFFTVCS